MSLNDYVRTGKFYQAVVEDGSDIIFVVDYKGTILYHNRSVNETLGYRSQFLVQKNFFEFVKPEMLPTFKKQFSASCRKSYTAGVEFQFRCKDGSFKFLEFNSINLKNKNNIPGLILDCRDITQRKQDAAELMRAQQARQLFLANISHEIRTPINGIAGMATLLNQLPKTEEQATYLNAIRSSSENLKVIINDILDLAAIESGKLRFEKIGFSVSDLLKNLQDQYSLQAKQRGIELLLQKEFEGNPVFVGDPVRLNQILLNLLSNAIKFTPAGYIVVRCEVKPKGKQQWRAQFSVKDTGIGIPREKLQTIFESFSQADASITRKFGGTGLGLTIVRQLVELQHGQIRVESRENEGSEFVVEIVYKRGKESELTQPASERSFHQQHDLHGLYVLLVEDNDINRLYAGSILKNMNCRFEIAENGFVAVEKLKNTAFDLVLMDIQMPVMDGYEATRAIRSSESIRQLPIIALTANANATEREKCREVGMNDCVSKPFTPQELFTCLSRFITVRPGAEQEQTVAHVKKGAASSISLQYLEKVSNNDPVFVRQMLGTISDSLPRSVQEIETALEHADLKMAARMVHRMKPSFDMIGKSELKAEAMALEEQLQSDHPRTGITQRLTAFLQQVKGLSQELTTLLSS
jgi:PAS domain S-box-containing protein